MILGVNGIRLVANRSGVARCIEAFLRCLDAVRHPFDEIIVYSPSPIPADITLPRGGRNVVVPSRLPPAAWEQLALPRAHRRRGVLFCPSYVAPVVAGCPIVVAHHGSYEGYRGRAFDRRTMFRAWLAYAVSAWRADAVTTVSEYSRRDMVRYYRLPPERIHVVPEGVDTDRFKPLADQTAVAAYRRELLGADGRFIAYVGKPTERRNLSAVIRAFARLKAGGFAHKLVVMGADLPGTSPFRRVAQETGVAADLVVRGHADHAEMALLFNATDLLVYPSSYEGFGMPVLEAMACGTPVIALDNTAFPEFAGGVALLLPDARVETLAQGIQRVLGDERLRAAMRVQGPRRAADYDWKLITQRYLDLIVPLAASWEAA